MSSTIGVYRVGQLGDTIAAVPAIRAIRDGYSDAQMVLISDQHSGAGFVSSWDILGTLDVFSERLFYDPSGAAPSGMLRYIDLARRIRKQRIETLFYLAPFPRSTNRVRRDHFFFKRLCGIGHCYGLEATDHLVGRRTPQDGLLRLPSETDRLLSIVAQAGIPIPSRGVAHISLPRGLQEEQCIDRVWRGAAFVRPEQVVAIGPGSKMPAKRWPHERFHTLIQRLLDFFPQLSVIVLGGPEDAAVGQSLAASLGSRVVNVAGQLSILESLEALRRCLLYIGNDTGTMHLAAAAGVQCVAIFSSRDHPGIWEPYGDGHTVLRKDPPCAGCFLTVCEEHRMACLMEIRVEDVFQACVRTLGESVRSNTPLSQPNQPEQLCVELQVA